MVVDYESVVKELKEWLNKMRLRNEEWDSFVYNNCRLGIPIDYLLDKIEELEKEALFDRGD